MNKLFYIIVIILTTSIYEASAQHSSGGKVKYGNHELDTLYVDNSKDLIKRENMIAQDGPSFNDREGRGALLPGIAGYLITKGTQAIQTMINNRKNRYTTQYNYAECDHYFYDQISTSSSNDITGLQFSGFKLVRLLRNGRNKDTMFFAKFIIDTTRGNLEEMMNNGIFHMRLDSIKIINSKIKAPKNYENLNLDFEIYITSSYRDDAGRLNTEAPLGKFIYTLRNFPLYKDDPAIQKKYDSINRVKPPLTGDCFMVPRSSGWYKNSDGLLQPCWGQGLYSIKVMVKETTKPKFIDKIIIYSSGPTLGIVPGVLQKKYASSASSSSSSSSKSAKK
ncbi:MAG TPA: hypothetical protein VIJ92_04195 [Ginsengibacter sp.]